MSIKIGEKKILRSPLEPKDKNWLWLKTVAGFPVLYEYLSGKWTPFSDATAEYMETHILSRVFGSTKYDRDNHCIEFYAADGSEVPIGVIDTSEFEVSIDADDYYTKTETEEFVAKYVSQHGGGGGADLTEIISRISSLENKEKVTLELTGLNYNTPIIETQDGVVLTGAEFKALMDSRFERDVEIVYSNRVYRLSYTSSEGNGWMFSNVDLENMFRRYMYIEYGSGAFDCKLYNESLSAAQISTDDAAQFISMSERTKLAGIAAGAEVNVQPNWTQTNTSADDYIKNKPTLATVATSGSYNDLQDKPTIPTVPTNVSAFTNDAGYTTNTGTITGITMNGASKGTSGVVDLGTVITAHQDISSKANASDVYTKTQTDTLLSGKQNTLTFDTTPTANSNNPVKSGGVKTYVDGKATITGITTSQDGTFTIALSDGNSYTVNLNHVHPQYLNVDDIDEYVTAGTNVTITKDSQTGVLEISASGGGSGTQVQANWNESDSTSAAYIQNKPTIPTVPTNVSSFTNDAGYLTSHQSLNGRVQSSDVTTIVVLADEAAYTALATKDSSTLYLIPES